MTLAEKSGRVDYRTVTASHIEYRIATMAWAMRFQRVRAVVEQLRTSWLTPRSIDLLRSRINRSGALTPDRKPYSFRFGNLRASIVDIHATCQANSASVGGVFDPFDDFYAALGRATMNIAVTGECYVDQGKARLMVDGLGAYLRDSYEFLGDQSLGDWKAHGLVSFASNVSDIAVTPQTGQDGDWSIGVGSVRMTIERYYRVSNGSFQDYRKANGKGGDFVIFTDVWPLALPPRPIEVAL